MILIISIILYYILIYKIRTDHLKEFGSRVIFSQVLQIYFIVI